MKKPRSDRQPEKTSDFVDEIIRDARAGRTFVPFIGSGLSSASGIIMGMEFTNYLAFTTYLILCDPKDRERTHGEGQSINWDLQRQGWPPLPSESEVNATRKWVMQQFVQLCKRLKLEPNYDSSDKHLIKSVASIGSRNPLDDLMSALTQPPIPLIIRSPEFTANDYRAKHLNKFLGSDSLTQLSPDILQLPHLADAGLSYEESLVETGLRSLGDWKETLTFLAMVRIVYSDPMRIVLDAVDSSVIDAFNSTITRDKRPNLGHKIIAHLSGPLRVSTLLTTNFDTLTEDAYRALALPLTVLPVSARGALPPARTVASADTLVKLHGEAHDTRADLTLDREPSEEDKLTFCAYLTRGTGHLLRNRKQSAQSEPAKVTKRLLVIGYSGNDYRCIQMIKHWLETAPDDPRVYWICFSDSDQRRLNDLFKSSKFSTKLVTTTSSRPDLLLYELYQKLVLSLPPGGLTYEFSHVLPPARTPAYDHTPNTVCDALESLRKPDCVARTVALLPNSLSLDAIVMHVKDVILSAVEGSITEDVTPFCQARKWWPCYRINNFETWQARNSSGNIVKKTPIVINASSGVVRASSLAAEHLASQRYRKVFWMELQDYRDSDAILRDILRSIALRFGQFQSRHVTMHPLMAGLPTPDSQNPEVVERAIEKLVTHLRSVLEEYRTDPTSIVFLLYGRNSYGNCSGLFSSTWSSDSETNEFHKLHMIIEVLARVGIPTVYFPLTTGRAKRKKETLENIRLKGVSIGASRSAPDQTVALWSFDRIGEQILNKRQADDLEYDVELLAQDTSTFPQIVSRSLHAFYQFELDKNGAASGLDASPRESQIALNYRQLAFIYALTLFRHSRHPNSVCSEAVFPCPFRYGSKSIDNDFTRALQSDRWAQELQQSGVFFVKQGGSIWMHRDIRLAIQGIVENTKIIDPRTQPQQPTSASQSPRTFLQMRAGMHYWIGDWYHKAFCSSGHLSPVTEGVHHMLMAAYYSQFAAPKRDGDTLTYRLTMFESALMQASKLLLLSWQWVELWQASSCEVSWLSESHAQEIHELLSSIPTALLKDQSEELKQRFSIRLHEAVEKFAKVMKALGRAVLLEGGGADRLPCAELSPVTVALRLSSDTARQTTPKLPHGTQEIRKSTDKLEEDIRLALETALKELPTPTATDLWKCITTIAQGDEKGKELAGKWKGEFKKSAYDCVHLHDLVWTLGEAAYVLLRRAKLHFHACRGIETVTWLKSTLCCNLAIDLCKLLPPTLLDFEIQSKIKLHSIYGLGLSNIGRFHEANRHLNEAQALLSKWNPSSQKEQATIALRRAEVKLTECHWISLFLGDNLKLDQIDFAVIQSDETNQADAHNPTATYFLIPEFAEAERDCWRISQLDLRAKRLVKKYPEFSTEICSAAFVPPAIYECLRTTKPIGLRTDDGDSIKRWKDDSQQMLRRLYASLLDEAVKLLEIGEKNLAGVSQSNLWWSRLRTLNLRIYGLLRHLPQTAESSLVFRKQSADLGIFKNFLSAVRIAGEDDFRLLRAIRYFAEANRWLCEFMEERKPSDMNDKELCRNFYQRYLPDSIKVAQSVFKEIDERQPPCKPGQEDLLHLAIKNCREVFHEIVT